MCASRILNPLFLKASLLTDSAPKLSVFSLAYKTFHLLLPVTVNHIHPTKRPSVTLNTASTPAGSHFRLGKRRLIRYLSSLLQYQIMYYALARHLPSSENHLFPTLVGHSVSGSDKLLLFELNYLKFIWLHYFLRIYFY